VAAVAGRVSFASLVLAAIDAGALGDTWVVTYGAAAPISQVRSIYPVLL